MIDTVGVEIQSLRMSILQTDVTLQGVERPRGRSGQGMALVHTEDGQHVIALHGGRTHEESLCKDTWILERTA